MEIIGEELGELKIDPEKISIVKRVIHTSADFDYARNMRFSEGVVEKALEALKKRRNHYYRYQYGLHRN